MRKQREEPPDEINGITDVVVKGVLEPVSQSSPLDAEDISRLWQAGSQTKKGGPAGRPAQPAVDGWSRGMKAEEKGLWDGDGGGEAADFELSDFAAAAEKFRIDTMDKNYGSDAVIAKAEDDPLERLLREDAATVAERQALEDDSVPEWAMEGGDDDANDDTLGESAESIHVDKRKSSNLMAALGVTKGAASSSESSSSNSGGTSMGGGASAIAALQAQQAQEQARRTCFVSCTGVAGMQLQFVL